MEFAHIAKRAGASEVTVLEMMDRPLGPFDPDLVAMLVEATEELGVDLRTKAKVAKIEKQGDEFTGHGGDVPTAPKPSLAIWWCMAQAGCPISTA